ncbi:MAG: hypothetical protein AAB369_01340 [Chloroflexota bacterium]
MTIHVLVFYDSRGRLIGPLAQGVAEDVTRALGERVARVAARLARKRDYE